MKKRSIIFLLVLFLGFSSTLFAQNKAPEAVEKMRVLVEKYYNENNLEALYALMGQNFKNQINWEKFQQISNNLKGQFGKWNKSEFWDSKDGLTHYKNTYEKATISFFINLDQEGKIQTYLFKPFKDTKNLKTEKVLTSNPLSTDLEKAIDKMVMENYMLMTNTVGLSVGIIKEGEMYFYHYGETTKGNQTLPDDLTLYEIGSISKTFTGYLLTKAIAEGKTEWTDSPNLFLPKTIAALHYQGKNITLRHLVNHSSGLPRMPNNIFNSPKTDKNNPYKNYTTEDMYTFLSQFKPTRAPEAQYEYSNLGFGLLGVILEKIYQKNYEELILEQICMPLQMKNTRITLSETDRKRLAQGYTKETQPTSTWEFQSMVAAGGIRSCLEDVMRYVAAQMYPLQTMKVTIEEMQQSTYQYGQTEVGIAWHLLRRGNYEIWNHSGGTGGYSTFVAFCPQTQNGVVLLSNVQEEVAPLGVQIIDWLNR
ncbi:MAG: hypothetical protein EAZ55_07815 [Cytophagales bacterium]|nr:MAG: hypothetical protein EAZ55_07815 [Cytophagales bacterium]